MADPLRFYFDYLSSNAYLGWIALPALAERFGRPIQPVPVVFAKLLEQYGQLGPAEVAPKMRWMVRNNLRKAVRLGIELRPPAFHPFNPLLALRVSSLAMADDARLRLVTGLFRAVWSEQRHVSEADVVAAIACEAGLDGPALVDAARESDTKERLRVQTADAIAHGVFGVPTVITDGELFFGYDDFPFLEGWLDGRDPLGRDPAQRWMGPQRPSAMRAPHRQRPPLRLSSVTLTARDPAALARWYAETFALESVALAERAACVAGPGTRIEFERADSNDAAASQQIGFDVASRDEVMIWARRFGSALADDPNACATRLRDPEGNTIEIYVAADERSRKG
jgi:2-hydroxychromene-2-carboxylate isomerase